jgi:hypothetical protein
MENYILKNRKQLSQFNYIRKADPTSNYWLDLSMKKINQYYEQFGEDFNIIICGDTQLEGDFFVIPYVAIKNHLNEEYLSNDKDGKVRWVGRIKNFELKINNCNSLLDLNLFYGNPFFINKSENTNEEVSNEYAIQNKRIEVESRQKQSEFRKKVLGNFQGKCCLTGINEEPLLIASYIIPWAAKIDSRLDPANGLCLSPLYDKLFDRGFITFENNLQVKITPNRKKLSVALSKILIALENENIKANFPVNVPIKADYLEYHRDVIFISS